MKRSTVTAVALTAGILIVAGNLPRLPWDGVARQWREAATRTVFVWPGRLRFDAIGSRPAAASRTAFGEVASAAALPATSFGRLRAPRAVEAALFAWESAGPITFAAGGALAGLAALVSLTWLAGRSPRDPRALVFRLAGRGEPMALIARHTRMPQDAVRTLLAPGVGSRRA